MLLNTCVDLMYIHYTDGNEGAPAAPLLPSSLSRDSDFMILGDVKGRYSDHSFRPPPRPAPEEAAGAPAAHHLPSPS